MNRERMMRKLKEKVPDSREKGVKREKSIRIERNKEMKKKVCKCKTK